MKLDPFALSLRDAAACTPGNAISFMNYRLYSVVDTTMNVADRMIGTSPPGSVLEGITIISHTQTNGIGSNGRSWASPPGNAYITRIVWVEACKSGQEVEMIAGRAGFEALRGVLPKHQRDLLSFKHPNDLLLDGVKLGGCYVSPAYDFDDVRGAGRYVSVGIGVNLQVAPHLPSGRPTTSLAAHGFRLGLADFARKFESRFTDILAHYRRENFDAILSRMGFLDSDGMVALKKENGEIRGTYAGFRAYMDVSGPKALIRLASHGAANIYDVHQHPMLPVQRRPAKIPRPRLTIAEAHA